MTQKERLIELLEANWSVFYHIDCELLADYLLDNGVIVPPCKVGDTVYFLERPSYIQKTFIYTGTVARITFVENIEILIYRDVDDSFYYRKPEHVFATEAEAEQALTVFQFKDQAEQALKERDGK